MKLKENGFKNGEFLESKQIKNYLAQKSRAQKKAGLNEIEENEPETDNENENEQFSCLNDVVQNLEYDSE